MILVVNFRIFYFNCSIVFIEYCLFNCNEIFRAKMLKIDSLYIYIFECLINMLWCCEKKCIL